MTRMEQLKKSLEYFDEMMAHYSRSDRKHMEVARACIERVLRLEMIMDRYNIK